MRTTKKMMIDRCEEGLQEDEGMRLVIVDPRL
jgi:hypothetical protein